ncbi:hypothetical protein JOD95_000721 [Curtobacterium sp. 1310]|nr:hypothetical protein [Curtobacterium sp. 1310]
MVTPNAGNATEVGAGHRLPARRRPTTPDG